MGRGRFSIPGRVVDASASNPFVELELKIGPLRVLMQLRSTVLRLLACPRNPTKLANTAQNQGCECLRYRQVVTLKTASARLASRTTLVTRPLRFGPRKTSGEHAGLKLIVTDSCGIDEGFNEIKDGIARSYWYMWIVASREAKKWIGGVGGGVAMAKDEVSVNGVDGWQR
jgi:hypothetical protein